jgi:hypothetical protein
MLIENEFRAKVKRNVRPITKNLYPNHSSLLGQLCGCQWLQMWSLSNAYARN